GAAPLAERRLRGKRVLLVVDDHTRPTPVARFFRAVRDALVQAGAEPHDIEILFAVGTHRGLTDAEAERKVGRDNLAAHRWRNHAARHPAGLVSLGTTARGTPVVLNRRLAAADLVVTFGAIEPHPLNGFTGGAKTVVPGCAGAATIGHNHVQGVTAERFNYVGTAPDDSPMRLNMEEAGAPLGTGGFLVNAVLSPCRGGEAVAR